MILLGFGPVVFMLLFAIVAISLTWMHTTIVISDKQLHPELKGPKPLPEMLEK